MLVRADHAGDHEAVRSLHQDAFGPEHGAVVARLVDALRRDDPEAVSLVAHEGERVVGHAMASRCLLDAPRRLVPVASLSPLAVAPPWQRRGIGSTLVREVLRVLDERRVPMVFLEGDPGYYGRLGFRRADVRRPSLRIPEVAFQVVRLTAYEPWMTGTFVYSDAFWRLDCVGLRDAAGPAHVSG